MLLPYNERAGPGTLAPSCDAGNGSGQLLAEEWVGRASTKFSPTL